ncbi:MAG TPA: fimbria/pilus periplasmic chaperone [Geminicoccaceae bacterium]
MSGSFNVSPIKIELPPDGSPSTVRVLNLESTPVLVRIEARSWADEIDSAPRSSEVLAVPPVVEVPGGGAQVVRLALRRPLTGSLEKAFRLLISEVPRERPDGVQGVTLTLRLALPIFVTPPGAVSDTSWAIVRTAGEDAHLVAMNKGAAHLLLKELKASDAELLEGATYVLAGESKSWPLDTPLSALPDVVEVRAETNRGPLVAEVRPRAQ